MKNEKIALIRLNGFITVIVWIWFALVVAGLLITAIFYTAVEGMGIIAIPSFFVALGIHIILTILLLLIWDVLYNYFSDVHAIKEKVCAKPAPQNTIQPHNYPAQPTYAQPRNDMYYRR